MKQNIHEMWNAIMNEEVVVNKEVPIKEVNPPFLKDLLGDLETIKHALYMRLLNINKEIRVIPSSDKEPRKLLKGYRKETDTLLNKARNLIIKARKLHIKNYEAISSYREEYLSIKDLYNSPKTKPTDIEIINANTPIHFEPIDPLTKAEITCKKLPVHLLLPNQEVEKPLNTTQHIVESTNLEM